MKRSDDVNNNRSGATLASKMMAEIIQMSQEFGVFSRDGVCGNGSKPNGALRDVVCRGVLLLLNRAGEIELPPARRSFQNQPEGWERPEPVVPDNTPVRGALYELMPLEFQQVRRTPQEPLFNSLMEQYHHLRYRQPAGEQLKYLVYAKGRRSRVWPGPRQCAIW
jgi:hypothetical protein